MYLEPDGCRSGEVAIRQDAGQRSWLRSVHPATTTSFLPFLIRNHLILIVLFRLGFELMAVDGWANVSAVMADNGSQDVPALPARERLLRAVRHDLDVDQETLVAV